MISIRLRLRLNFRHENAGFDHEADLHRRLREKCMPKTAYSAHFRKEMDVFQLMAALTGQPVTDGLDPRAVEAHAAWIKEDIECPICRAKGASIVQPTRSAKGDRTARQAHFRFRNLGEDGHHPECDFYGDAKEGARSSEGLVSFGSDRSAETRLVRELFCRGVEQGVFDQSTTHEMRDWFFKRKLASRETFTTTREKVEWAQAIRQIRGHSAVVRAFYPALGDLTGFDWGQAAREEFQRRHGELVRLTRRPISDDAWHRAAGIADRTFGLETFNVLALRKQYEATLELSVFIATMTTMKSRQKAMEFRFHGAPSHLLALCALILFTAKWDINQAIAFSMIIMHAPPAADLMHGNVMGLNPFHDFAAWEALASAAEASKLSPGGLDLDEQLRAIEAELQERYRDWKARQLGSHSSCPNDRLTVPPTHVDTAAADFEDDF